MSADISWVTVALAVAAPIVGFVGVMIGQTGSRGREVREMRRPVYVDWLKTIQNLVPPQSTEEVWSPLLPDIAARLNDKQAELAVVGSKRVLAQTAKMIEVVTGDAYKSAVLEAKAAAQVYTAHRTMIHPLRQRLVELMRQDMLPWWRPRSRQLG